MPNEHEPVRHQLFLDMPVQPSETTCGQTCLHALYRYYGDDISIDQLIEEVPIVEGGGTIAVNLGIHALMRGYRATLYTYNLKAFDPTWFNPRVPDFLERLERQLDCRSEPKLLGAIRSYSQFYRLGGGIEMEDLTGRLLRRHLTRHQPILTGLSSTYLYQMSREDPDSNGLDDVRGHPGGHFVLLCGYDKETQEVLVADSYKTNPFSSNQRYYHVAMARLVNSILLGVLTYDGNMLVITPSR
ncbi:MAG: hypothetical protein SFY80_02335 [Verrucomicrobiota bacterium]|nr:hypothetical protein [Verrucomicrobiota bacterium]